MNSDAFSHRWETKLFLSIAATGVNSVVVLSRPALRTSSDEQDKGPSSSWNKSRHKEDIKGRDVCQMIGLSIGFTESRKSSYWIMCGEFVRFRSTQYRKFLKNLIRLQTLSRSYFFQPHIQNWIPLKSKVFSKTGCSIKEWNFRLNFIKKIAREQIYRVTTEQLRNFCIHVMKTNSNIEISLLVLKSKRK